LTEKGKVGETTARQSYRLSSCC